MEASDWFWHFCDRSKNSSNTALFRIWRLTGHTFQNLTCAKAFCWTSDVIKLIPHTKRVILEMMMLCTFSVVDDETVSQPKGQSFLVCLHQTRVCTLNSIIEWFAMFSHAHIFHAVWWWIEQRSLDWSHRQQAKWHVVVPTHQSSDPIETKVVKSFSLQHFFARACLCCHF